MKKNSDKAAERVLKIVLGLGLAAALLSPIGGAVLGGWSTASAAAAAIGLGAAVPLAGAGAFGGFVLGSIAAPFVAVGSLFVAGGAALLAKAVASPFDRAPAAAAQAPDTQRAYTRTAGLSRLGGLKISRSFDLAAERLEERQAKTLVPKPKMVFAPRL